MIRKNSGGRMVTEINFNVDIERQDGSIKKNVTTITHLIPGPPVLEKVGIDPF